MKSLFFKPTMLVMVVVCLMNSIQEISSNFTKNNSFFLGGGHIEVVGDFLIGDTGDPSIFIEEITLSGAESYETSACGKNICSFNISNVISGTYEATLHGTAGYEHTEIVIIR